MFSIFNSVVFPSPKKREFPLHELIWIPNGDENIPCLYIPCFSSNKLALYFHGNSEDIFDSKLPKYLSQELSISIISIEYPGYSVYNSPKDDKKFLSNALTVFDIISQKITFQTLYIIGRSIGTAPAIHLASQRSIDFLILISPFINLKTIISEFKLVGSILNTIFKEKLDNTSSITKILAPTLFIHGMNDNIIPHSHSQYLAQQMNSILTEIHLSFTMTHNNFDLNYDIVTPIKNMLQKVSFNDKKSTKFIINPILFCKPLTLRKTHDNLLISRFFHFSWDNFDDSLILFIENPNFEFHYLILEWFSNQLILNEYDSLFDIYYSRNTPITKSELLFKDVLSISQFMKYTQSYEEEYDKANLKYSTLTFINHLKERLVSPSLLSQIHL